MANGTDKLKRILSQLPVAITTEVKAALQKTAEEAVERMRYLAPEDSGALRESIRITPGEHELALKVEAGGPLTTKNVRAGSDQTFDYAIGVEFGTVEASAQPFVRPTARSLEKRNKTRNSRAINKAVKKVTTSGT